MLNMLVYTFTCPGMESWMSVAGKTQLFLGYKYLKCVRFLPKRIFEKYYLCRSSIQERKEKKDTTVYLSIHCRPAAPTPAPPPRKHSTTLKIVGNVATSGAQKLGESRSRPSDDSSPLVIHTYLRCMTQRWKRENV